MTGPIERTGHIYRAADRARPELLEQPREGEHVWIAMAIFRVLDVDGLRKGEKKILDGDTLASIYTGCYVCEEPFSERISYRRCKGEPR